MAKALWFVGGFVLALCLVAALVMGPLMKTRAGETPLPAPTALSSPTLTLAATPTPPASTATLSWQRQGGYLGLVQRLEVVNLNEVRYTPDGGGPRVALLTQAEREALVLAIARYAPFDYGVQESLDGFSQVMMQLRFAGLGRQAADEAARRELARWAAEVFQRLATEEQRADLLALARLDLAQRTGLAVEQIEPLSVSAVTWPNACLDIREAGVACAQVMTEGYQLQLRAGDAVYEYRTNLRGLVRLAGRLDQR
jgi:hypothetical protein